MPYIHFTDEQKLRANSVDLAEFLRRQGEKLIPSGREKRLASDHSITVRGNEWFDHASEQGGHAISFVQQFYNLSYPEAVMKLLDGECAANYILTAPEPMEETKEFALPPASTSMRRMYAYLIQQRLIAWEVINAFVKRDLIYESCEKSKNQTKEYHNAVFVGFDEHGVARHAHRRGIYTQGKSFRGNVTGCNPRYSFHWTGTGSKLYVFEAPIDMLAFITLYPDGWQSNSYVALCGTAEHAMLWMLEQNPQLEKVILCLDHDAAGIEAAGRLAEILRTQGCLLAAPLLPQYKDWDEELKARCGRDAQPAREHPQSIVKEEVCSRIAEKGAAVQPDRAIHQLPALLQSYQKHLRERKMDLAVDAMEQISACAFSLALREHKQLGTPLPVDHAVSLLQDQMKPHTNRASIPSRTAEITSAIQAALLQTQRVGIRGEEEKRKMAQMWMELAVSCAKIPVKYAADELAGTQKQALAHMQQM